MRTITTTTNLYKYDELSDDAKAKAKQLYLNDEGFMQVRAENFTEFVKEDIGNLFGWDKHELDVQWSLSHSQGDGVNIYGKISADVFLDAMDNRFADIPQLKEYVDALTDHEKKTIRAYAEVVPSIELPSNHWYCYCVADKSDIAGEFTNELEWNDYKNIDVESIEKFEKVVVGVFETLCSMYEDCGYGELYEVDEVDIAGLADLNDWEFTEDGTIY